MMYQYVVIFYLAGQPSYQYVIDVGYLNNKSIMPYWD
jgi:hypothetical protein